MQKLVEGVHAFHAQYFTSHRDLFTQLAESGQHPETLFITCSDSRVVPNLITNSAPGELFTIRNVGNIVPMLTLAGGTVAAVQFAVEVLAVQTIVVCGHTHCGAVEALLHPERVEHLTHDRQWLAQADRVRTIVADRYGHLDEAARMIAAVEENVLVQLENLRSYPFVARRLEEGKLRMNGWVFKIDTGEVFDFDPANGQFVPLVAEPK